MTQPVPASPPAVLDGVTVLERGDRIGCAICGSLLAQLGATVVNVEHPAGPRRDTKEQHRDVLAAGKLSLLAGPADAPLLAGLAARSDVVLLSSDTLPGAGSVAPAGNGIVCDVTAFGGSGPMRGLPYTDAQIQALSGVLDATGHADGPPVPVGIPLTEIVSGIYAAGAVLAALRLRRLTGLGQPIEIALFDVAFSLMTSFLPGLLAGDAEAASGRVGNRQTMVAPWNVYRAADGWLLLCAGSDEQWRRICQVIGRPELGTAAPFATVAARLARVGEVDAVVGGWIAVHPLDHCVARFAAATIACGPIAPIGLFPVEANLAHRGMVREATASPTGAPMHLPGSPLRMDRTPGRGPTHSPAPDAGRDAAVALTQFLFPLPAQAAGPAHAPLAGLRVVEIGHYTTAPLAARHLANLGAEVIKIEPPGGEPVRGWPPLRHGQGVFFTFQNADKKSLVLDIRSADGLAALRALLADADVLIENLKPGALAKGGLTADALHALNPRLVYCSVSGFGHHSLYAGRPAFDAVIQATSGLMDVSEGGSVPLKTGPSSADIMGAATALLATLAALEHRDRTGLGQHVDLSMQDIGAWATQTAWNGARSRGTAARTLPCADGYVCVEDGASPGPLSPLVVRATRDAAASQLSAAGRVAAPVRTVAEAMAEPQTRERRLWFEVQDGGASHALLGSPLRLGLTPATVSAPGPALGRHTAEVLRRVAMPQADAAAGAPEPA